MKKRNISFIFGTRPELIKIAPLVQACKKEFNVKVISTGQHRELLNNLLHWFSIEPEINLDIMKSNQSPSKVIATILSHLEAILVGSDLVIVQGDTASAYAGAMSAFLHQIPVAHLEAGLRTNNRYNPFPEEIFRRQITQVADIHFAPTEQSAQNIRKEGFEENVYVVGNTVIDSLKQTTQRLLEIEQSHQIGQKNILKNELSKFVDLPFRKELEGKRILLVTMHRRENLGQDHEQVASALREIVEEFKDTAIVFPIHPNPMVRKAVEPLLANQPRVHLIQPIDYITLAWLLQKTHILITDSGGLQEEGASIGKPTLVLRETTERPEAVEAGVAKLVGTDKENVKNELRLLLANQAAYDKMAQPSSVYGDGKTSEKIVELFKNNNSLNCLFS